MNPDMGSWWRWLMPLAAYLLGSVSFAWIIGRLHGVDLRHHGSHSLGATNAGRVLGGRWFFVVFALDVAKGWAPVFTADRSLGRGGDAEMVLVLLVGVAAVLGHIFSCFHRFKGGKAVATVAAPIVHLLVAERPWNGPELLLTVFILLLTILVVLKHRSNITKLLGRARNA